MSLGIMKKLLLAILATTALAACSDHTIDATPNVAIEFGIADTRAENEDAINIDKFKVFGQMSCAPDEAYDTPNDIEYISIFDQDTIYLNDGVYTYDKKRYWVDDRTFHFFAVWPLSTEVTVDASFQYQLDFTTPDTADADLLADHYSTYVDPNIQVVNRIVPIEFTHLLSKVALKITRDGANNQLDNFWVKSVQLTNIKRGGTFTTSRFNQAGSWYFNDEIINFKKEYDTPIPLNLNGEESSQLIPWNGLLLIPQAIQPGNLELVIEYQYQAEGQTDSTNSIEDRTVRTYIPAMSWVANQSYVYHLVLKESNVISFKQIEVAEWGSHLTGGTIIIK